jgi:hypothetical protein
MVLYRDLILHDSWRQSVPRARGVWLYPQNGWVVAGQVYEATKSMWLLPDTRCMIVSIKSMVMAGQKMYDCGHKKNMAQRKVDVWLWSQKEYGRT